MSSVLVSIVMPAYNAELFIAQSIDSVIAQTYTNWELLIVDDGSTDRTSTIVREYQKTDERIQYYYQENSKQAVARNHALKYSKGELVAFLDSDDLWLPEKLERSLNEFMSFNQDVLFTDAYIFHENSQLGDLNKLSSIQAIPGVYSGYEGLSLFLQENKIPILTVLAKKSAICSANGFISENRGGTEDYELWLNLLVKGYVIRGISDKLSIYRIHQYSTTANNNMTYNVIVMLKRFFDANTSLKGCFNSEIIQWINRYVFKCRTPEDIDKVVNKKFFNSFSLNFRYLSIIRLFRGILSCPLYQKIVYEIYNSSNDK